MEDNKQINSKEIKNKWDNLKHKEKQRGCPLLGANRQFKLDLRQMNDYLFN